MLGNHHPRLSELILYEEGRDITREYVCTAKFHRNHILEYIYMCVLAREPVNFGNSKEILNCTRANSGTSRKCV